MNRKITHALLLAAVLSCSAAQADNRPMPGFRYDRNVTAPTGKEWEDPTMPALNKERPHAWFFSFADEKQALNVLPESSPYWKSLDGEWSFNWVGNPGERPRRFLQD